MRSLPDIPIQLRILAIGLAAILLNLSHQPHRLSLAWTNANRTLKNGAPASAAAYLREALNYEPWRDDLWIAAGRYAFEGQDYTVAAILLEEAGKRGLLTHEDRLILGDAYLAMQNLERALQCWQEALNAGGPALDIYFKMLPVYEEKRDFTALLEVYQALARLKPGDGEIYFKTGLYMAVHEPESALVFLDRAAELDAQYARQARKLQDDIRKASLAEVPAFSLVSTGRSLASLGHWVLAKEAFQRAIELEPDYAEAWAFLAEARQQIGGQEIGWAWSDLRQALQLDPNSLAVNLLAALYFRRQGEYDQAEKVLIAAAVLEPQNPIVQVELGNVYTNLGELQKAEAAYRKAIELRPADISFRKALVNFLLKHQIQLKEQALPIAREAVILAPKDAAALDLLGETLFLLGDLHGSKRLLDRAVKTDPAYAPALMHLGVTLLYLEEREQAREYIEMAQYMADDAETIEQSQRLLQYYFP